MLKLIAKGIEIAKASGLAKDATDIEHKGVFCQHTGHETPRESFASVEITLPNNVKAQLCLFHVNEMSFHFACK
jgi:hypothetical protein